MSVSARPRLNEYDAVIVGGALYSNRWVGSARRFVLRHVRELRRVPTWFFSSGPLDDSATRGQITPTKQVAILMERVGALGRATFGGRLAPDAKGFPAAAMAKTRSGDWRDPTQIREWATAIAGRLPAARPGTPIEQPGRSPLRLALHGVTGWALCAAVMMGLMRAASLTTALVVHAVAAPVLFALVARHYFAARGAREPLPTATAFVAIVATLDLTVVALIARKGFAMFGSALGFWLPITLIFFVTLAVGTVSSILPVRPERAAS